MNFLAIHRYYSQDCAPADLTEGPVILADVLAKIGALPMEGKFTCSLGNEPRLV